MARPGGTEEKETIVYKRIRAIEAARARRLFIPEKHAREL